MRMAMAVNALGLPAVGLPVGIRDGLPQAVQLIAPRYREDLCLDAAFGPGGPGRHHHSDRSQVATCASFDQARRSTTNDYVSHSAR